MPTRPLGPTAKALISKAEKLGNSFPAVPSFRENPPGRERFGRSLRSRSIKLLTRNPGQTWASARRLIERRMV